MQQIAAILRCSWEVFLILDLSLLFRVSEHRVATSWPSNLKMFRSWIFVFLKSPGSHQMSATICIKSESLGKSGYDCMKKYQKESMNGCNYLTSLYFNTFHGHAEACHHGFVWSHGFWGPTSAQKSLDPDVWRQQWEVLWQRALRSKWFCDQHRAKAQGAASRVVGQISPQQILRISLYGLHWTPDYSGIKLF